MSNNKKLADRILNATVIPNDITPNEFISLITYLGYTYRQGAGSHIIVMDPNDRSWHITVVVGHKKDMDPKAIKEIKEHYGKGDSYAK